MKRLNMCPSPSRLPRELSAGEWGGSREQNINLVLKKRNSQNARWKCSPPACVTVPVHTAAPQLYPVISLIPLKTSGPGKEPPGGGASHAADEKVWHQLDFNFYLSIFSELMSLLGNGDGGSSFCSAVPSGFRYSLPSDQYQFSCKWEGDCGPICSHCACWNTWLPSFFSFRPGARW